MKYNINVNDTPEKEDYFVVIIIDDKTKTSSSFAMAKNEKVGKATQLIKSALFKVQHEIWKPTKKTKVSKTKKKTSKKPTTKR